MNDVITKEVSKKLDDLAREEDTATKNIPTSINPKNNKIDKLVGEDDLDLIKPKDTRSFVEKAAEKYDEVHSKAEDAKRRYYDPIKTRYDRHVSGNLQKEKEYLESKTEQLARRNKYREQQVRGLELEKRRTVTQRVIAKERQFENKQERRANLFGGQGFGSRFTGRSTPMYSSNNSNTKSILFNSGGSSSNANRLLFGGSSRIGSKFNLNLGRKKKL